MTFTITSLIYFFVICLIFYGVRKELRMPVLLIACLIYVHSYSSYVLAAVLITGLLSWLAGLLIHFSLSGSRRQISLLLTVASIGAFAVSLAFFKYLPIYGTFTGKSDVFRAIILPVGYSFYVFQIISYLADIYKGTIECEKNVFHFLLYLSWFPKFISGPIERYDVFRRQYSNIRDIKLLDRDRWNSIFHYLIIGLFYKLVIADRLSVYVNTLFDYYSGFSNIWLIIGILFYTIQIYCDFAGYSFAAIGISLAFGIDLTQNFLSPYCSENITDFWRRWHRSLSSWLRDYIYIFLSAGAGKAKQEKN